MTAAHKIKTTYNEIWVDEEGFLVLKLLECGEIGLQEVKACFEAYQKLGFGPSNKVLQLIDIREDGSMAHDARTYAAEHGKHFFIASAVISKSLAVRMIVNFFNAFYKHPVPFKMFSEENDAKNWLRSFRVKK
ncbi:MAG: STAS/SEC14 domain-containing protein [Bacteroidetes bacterium]|nr:STAS/SEC14 domain-containing protein [Bacteroidota bacterium]